MGTESERHIRGSGTSEYPVGSTDGRTFVHGPAEPVTDELNGEQIACLDSKEPFLKPLMSSNQRLQHLILTAIWLVALAFFWTWWLQPENNIGSFKYWFNTVVIGWVTLVPIYFVAIASFAQVPIRLPLPRGYRVAMVVTKAPSEPFPVVQRTLEAMLRQTYPHDTWLADEDPSAQTIRWCRDHGVKISTRKGRTDYHRTSWPRRTRCKEGNLAFFYDHYGYDSYDFVIQLDADHVPDNGYLEEMLCGFADPRVGYVSAPSICNSNGSHSWSARGRLDVEAALHGLLQAGYAGAGLAPLCIGSHYAVRTKALKEIGGLGPELAEDHSTTLMMNAHGWRGVHAIDAIAQGAGPETFADLATQEFQWSRSLVTIFLRHTPAYYHKLPFRLKLQFVFCQLWYPLFSITMLAMYLLPITAILLDQNMVGVHYIDFIVRFLPIEIALIGMSLWWKKQKWIRPLSARILSWEGAIFTLVRWPWSLMGALAALSDWIFGSTSDFRITPKGSRKLRSMPLRVLAPYVFLSTGSALSALTVPDLQSARGFYVFAAINSLVYAAALVIILLMRRYENGDSIYGLRDSGFENYLAIIVIMLSSLAIFLRVPDSARSFISGYEHVSDQIMAKAGSLEIVRYLTGRPSERNLAWPPAMTGPKAKRRVQFGVYDPEQIFSKATSVYFEHVFIQWQIFEVANYRSIVEYAEVRKRRLVVTVEPWTRAKNWTDGGESLLKDVVAGRYDGEISAICAEIGLTRSPVSVRWGHEMEDDSGRYPWANRPAQEYIAAYRYFVDRCREFAPQATYIWSPQANVWSSRGLAALKRYYPGDTYVDVVGVSVYALEARDIDQFGKALSPKEVLTQCYKAVVGFKKPIIIAELGIRGNGLYKEKWLEEIFGLDNFEEIFAAIYFNSRETGIWPYPYGSPDWRIAPDDLPKVSAP